MSRRSQFIHRRLPSWWPAILPLLLASALTSAQLDDMAFNRDEPASLLAAGVYASGPATLAETWHYLTTVDSTPAMGFSSLLFFLGRVVGWSEPAIRSLSFFAGLLALALICRCGRDMFSPQAGLLAAALTAGSAFFLSYMVIARAFTFVALFTAMIVWGYWHLTLERRRPGPGPAIVLLAGGAGLLWSHYFAALFLPALALFHLLFAPKTRRWWLPVLTLAIALALALPQAPAFLNGLAQTQSNVTLRADALGAAAVTDRLLRFFSNFLIRLPPPGAMILLALLPPALVYGAWKRRRDGRPVDSSGMLALISAAALLLMVAANEVAGVITGSRMRYLMPLLPLTMLLAGAALARGIRAFPRAGLSLPAFWLFLGAALFYGDAPWLIDRRPSTVHHVQRVLQERAAAGDLVIFSDSLKNNQVLYLAPRYIRQSEQPWETIFWNGAAPLSDAVPVHSPWLNIWLVWPAGAAPSLGPEAATGRIPCERHENIAGFTLERHARAAAGCAGVGARLEFERGVQLTGIDFLRTDEFLRVEAGLRSADDYLLAHYSLALHVIDPRTGERVAQGDVGVGPGQFVPLRSDVDLTALPPGEYELHVALYDWQTGERLNARDLQSGAVSDVHVLHRFRIE